MNRSYYINSCVQNKYSYVVGHVLNGWSFPFLGETEKEKNSELVTNLILGGFGK